MHRGFTKLWRKIEDSPIVSYGLKPIGLFALFLIKANHEPKTWKGEPVNSGQFITSINNLSLMVSESPKVVRRLLKILEENEMITSEIRANKWHKLTICNWGIYQVTKKEEDKQKTNRGASSGNESDLQLENEENEENIIPPISPRGIGPKGKEEISNSFTPPSREDMARYCENELSDYDLDPNIIFLHYSENDWRNSQNKPVSNWKNTIRNNWCKPDRKKKAQDIPEHIRKANAYVEKGEY